MDYTLAKELKDAGFPQHRDCTANDCFNTQGQDACAPTLSELIEACGDISMSLGKYTEGAYPEGRKSYAWYGPAHGSGMTLDEAVARLWLALNKK
jgi:hypothetical protein